MRYLVVFCLLIAVSACKSPEARKPISRTSGTFIKESAERNKRLNDKEKRLIEAVIAKDTTHNYIASKNGFWYYYATKTENDTITPQFGDIVKFEYAVKDLNGNTIYNKEELQPQVYAMDKQELFSGLREGLKLLKAGESATFIFPSLKAYGYYGDENKIGRSVPLICDVKVQSITKQ